MRLILGISLLLLGVGTLSCRVEVFSAQPLQACCATEWIRTADGWERAGSWTIDTVEPPRLHPFVIAAGQGLVSLLALAAFQREAKPADRKC
jgi:hypothetical protein